MCSFVVSGPGCSAKHANGSSTESEDDVNTQRSVYTQVNPFSVRLSASVQSFLSAVVGFFFISAESKS